MNLKLYTCDLCASSNKRWGRSRSFQDFNHLTHLVAYSKKKVLFIHPFGEALTMTPTGTPCSQSFGTLPPLWIIIGGMHCPMAFVNVSAVEVSPCSLPTIVTASIPVSPTTSLSFGTSTQPISSQFHICCGFSILSYFNISSYCLKNFCIVAGLAHITLFTHRLCAWFTLTSGCHRKKNLSNFLPALLYFIENPINSFMCANWYAREQTFLFVKGNPALLKTSMRSTSCFSSSV